MHVTAWLVAHGLGTYGHQCSAQKATYGDWAGVDHVPVGPHASKHGIGGLASDSPKPRTLPARCQAQNPEP